MKRIFAAGISQESNSFNPLKSRYEDFVIHRGRDFRQMPGVKQLIAAGFEVVESVFAKAVPGGTLGLEDFLRLVEEMLAPLETDSLGFDGVFLPMHGALDVERIGSGETFIAARVREIVGAAVPIASPLDMHGNITYALANACNIICGFRTAPHVDVAETYERAARLLIRAIEEEVLPRNKVIRIPCVMPGENMMTQTGIGKKVIDFLPKIEEGPNIWCASYFVGMAWVDCYYNGAQVIVTGVGDMEAGMAKAAGLADFVWSNRAQFKYQGLACTPEDAIAFVKEHWHDGPVIVQDSADNVTAGAAGDNCFLLNQFLRHGIQSVLFAAIVDPRAVAEVTRRDVGDVVTLEIGGAFDTGSVKAALEGAVVKRITQGELCSCVLSYCGIDILLFDKRRPVFDEAALNVHGLSLADYNVLVVKQGYLSPELNLAAKHSVMALTPGNCCQSIVDLDYKKMRKRAYPLDNL